MRTTISHEFVDAIPDRLADGVLYVCIPYATVVHKCLCGCGHEVVTPLAPHQWKLIFDGETISLTPSIGNWSFPCRSHYWISADAVRVARTFDDTDIATLRANDHERLQQHYASKTISSSGTGQPAHWWTRVRAWLRKKSRKAG